MEKPSIGMIPSAYKDGKLYSVYPLEGLGEELVTNGDLSTSGVINATSYSLGFVSSDTSANFTISNEQVTIERVSGSARLRLSNGVDSLNILDIGKQYRLVYDVVSDNLSSFKYYNGLTVLNAPSTVGQHTIYFISQGTQFYLETQNNGSSITLDNISIKEDTSADFDFTRGSLATRVNAQGLVEDVNIISEELTQNGNFDEIGSEEISNGSFSQEGSEEITNGSFDTDSDWTKGIGWTISGGKASRTAQASSSVLTADNTTLTVGKTYKCVMTISDYSSGSARFETGSTGFTLYSENGTFVEYIVATGTTFSVKGNSSFTGSIDNVSVVEVGQDWIFPDGWEIGDNKASFDFNIAGASNLRQDDVLTVGKIYKLTFDTLDSNEGNLGYYFGGNATFINNIEANTTHTVYGEAVGTYLSLRGSSNFIGSVTNVSVKEVGQNWNFGAGWSIEDGKAVATDAYVTYLTSSQNLTIGKKYKITYTVSDYVKGVVRYRGNSSTVGASRSANGTYTDILTTTTTVARLQGLADDGGFTGSIDNVSIKEITDATDLPRLNYDDITWQEALSDELITNGGFDTDSDWTLATRWSISGGKAICNANGGFNTLRQTGVLTSGKIYKITLDFDSSGITSGSFKLNGADFGNASSAERNIVDGTNVFYVEATSNSFGINESGAVGTGIFDNVSIKEVTGQEVASSGCPSLLLEPQSTNLYPYSEEMSSWNGNFNSGTASLPTVTDSYSSSPDGTQNASRVVLNLNGGTSLSDRTALRVLLSATTDVYTQSFYLKSNTSESYEVAFHFLGGHRSTYTVTPEWQRFSHTEAATTSTIYTGIELRGSITSGYADISVWGAQFEELPYASSYIPTNGSVATRLADSASRSGLQDHINSTEGVLYAEIAALSDDGTYRILSLSDGTEDERVYIQYTSTSNSVAAVVKNGGVTQANKSYVLSDETEFAKVAFKFKQNDFALWVNGIEVGTDTSGNVPTGLSRIAFDNAGGVPFYGKVKDLRVYTTALSDEDLQYLTT